MVSLPGICCKQYVQGGAQLGEVSCPNPECQGARLQGHGSYDRYLGGELRPLQRGRCPRCGVTHALFPEDLCAYRDATFEVVEAAFSAGTPGGGAKGAGQTEGKCNRYA